MGVFKFGSAAGRRGGMSVPLPLDRPPADVAAANTLRPLDAIDRRTGAALRFDDGLAERRACEPAEAQMTCFMALSSIAELVFQSLRAVNAFQAARESI